MAVSGTTGKTIISVTPATREQLRLVQRNLMMQLGRTVSADEAVRWLLKSATEGPEAVSRETRDTP
jgi:hypothetical protein